MLLLKVKIFRVEPTFFCLFLQAPTKILPFRYHTSLKERTRKNCLVLYMTKDLSEAIMKRSEQQSMHIKNKAIETEVGTWRKEILALTNTTLEEENLIY